MNREIELFLYTRAGCTACDVFSEALDGHGLKYHTIDIDTDPELIYRYGARIPVLVAGDTEVCEGRYNKTAVSRLLQSGQSTQDSIKQL